MNLIDINEVWDIVRKSTLIKFIVLGIETIHISLTSGLFLFLFLYIYTYIWSS